jgi:S-(hydroxymethyl)glutathione dehydrogenase/alcohol dehydrogenase
MFRHYQGVSSFAEEVVVPETGAIKICDDASLDTMVLVGCGVGLSVVRVARLAGVIAGVAKGVAKQFG